MTTDAYPESRLERIVPLLMCPACRGSLRLGNALQCAGCRATYPLHHGRPAFLPNGAEPKLMPGGHVSNQPPDDAYDRGPGETGWVLNLGAGGTATKPDHVIEAEYSVFRNTDVATDAHHLPFADNTFDRVVTFNTFEHLYDPPRAAAEVYRVLKPGGRLRLHTAFLQPVHEAPYHFYDTTEFGLRRWFQGFDIEAVSVTDNFHPGYVFAWLAATALHAVGTAHGAAAQADLANSTLGFWNQIWCDPKTRTKDGPFGSLRTLPQELMKNFSAGFELLATKPK